MDFSRSYSDEEFIEIYERNVDNVYQVCFMYLKNKADTEDAVQNTFLKLYKKFVRFNDLNHEKAWLIVTASNICKNNLKYWFKKQVSFIDVEEKHYDKYDDTLKLILNMPDKYKLVLYMYYYMGYKSSEIAIILKLNESTVRSHLKRGRNILKGIIKEDE